MNVRLTEKDKVKILNSDDVFAAMQKILLRENKIDRDKEHFWIIGLNVSSKILFIELVSMGSVKASTVEPMNVFRVAVLKNAVKVILIHNHPSNEVKPSINDKNLTDRLIQVGRILDIEVIDHLIITLRSYLSFEDIGLMSELRKSTEWLPAFELIERVKKEEAKIRKEAVMAAKEKGLMEGEKIGEKRGIKKGREEGEKIGEKRKAIEIAKALKEKGIDPTVIAETSGLTKKEIEKL